MKKKILSIALAAALGATMFAGCGNSSSSSSAASSSAASSAEEASAASSTEEASAASSAEEASAASSTEEASAASSAEATSASSETKTYDIAGKKVTALFFSLEGEFFNLFNELLQEGLEAQGVEYSSQSSNMDDVTLIEQLENAVAGGADLVWVWATNGDAVADACKAAMDAGTIVYTFVQDPGEGNRTRARGTDEVQVGEAIGQTAGEWADENRPDAGDGEINCLIFGNSSSTNQKERTDAIVDNLDSRFNVVERLDVELSTPEAKTTMENMVAKYGDTIDAIMCVSGNQVIGIDSYLESDACEIDAEKIGIIGCEVTEEIADYIKKGLYYGGAVVGGNPMVNASQQIDEICTLLQDGADVYGDDTFSAVDVTIVKADNVAEYGY